MKYNTVEIRPTHRNEWQVSFSHDPTDRVEKPTRPSGLGVYHYPDSTTKEEAFNALKRHMIDKHLDEIKRLQKSLQKLYNLEIEQ